MKTRFGELEYLESHQFQCDACGWLSDAIDSKVQAQTDAKGHDCLTDARLGYRNIRKNEDGEYELWLGSSMEPLAKYLLVQR